ncbi:hypothetical protein LTR84_005326 [Exophiala bonariae]|uniref:Uncharacterized protein n=1 Tax=Exophiala bonariae TaxID=1690606 RepID=A0AAV9N3I4_9EURO|nr:hypothetical protein LTR84_005326 [Exophiala bonariae]
MHILSCALLSSLVVAHARDLGSQPQLRYLRRDNSFVNNTITTRSTINIPLQLNNITTSTLVPTTTRTISIDTDHITSWIAPIGSIPLSTSSPSPPPPYQNISTTEPTCTGFATYFESAPPTVFLTVTEGFEVTVTASNVSVTASETLITPLPACGTTILPAPSQRMTMDGEPFGSDFATFTKSVQDGPPGAPGRPTQNLPQFATFQPLPPQTVGSELATATAPLQSSTAPLQYSSVPYTSTVLVTKKTPVTVVVPPTTSPGVNFQITEPTFNGEGNTIPPPKQTMPNGNNNIMGPNGGRPTDNRVSSSSLPSTTSRTSLGLGNLVSSIIFSGIPRPPRETGRSTTVDGIPVVIYTSSIVIGDQSFAVPTSSRTTVQVNGVGFALGPSEIVAPSTTITVGPGPQDQRTTITPRPTSTTVTVGDDFTFVVGQTLAVIAGTTYRVGEGAPATTITIDGTTVSVGSNGVELPRTIVSPVGASASGYVIYTVNGITFSVDDNEAVLSSTTYRIGTNAPQMTTVVSGATISFGPSGIGLQSTTIAPTAVPSSSATTGARSSSSSGAATGVANNQNASPAGPRINFSELLGWYLIPTWLVCNFLF